MKKDYLAILFLLSVTQPGLEESGLCEIAFRTVLTPVGFAAPARARCAFIASGKSFK